MRAKIEAELEERVARDIQVERDRVAAESAALQEKMREFEEQRKATSMQVAVEMEAQKAAAERAVAEREAALAVREQEAAQTLALGRALSQASRVTQDRAVILAGGVPCFREQVVKVRICPFQRWPPQGLCKGGHKSLTPLVRPALPASRFVLKRSIVYSPLTSKETELCSHFLFIKSCPHVRIKLVSMCKTRLLRVNFLSLRRWFSFGPWCLRDCLLVKKLVGNLYAF